MKRRGKASIAPVLFLALVGYFGWNATQGDHGLVAYAERKRLLQQAEADQANAQTERDTWARRVSGLQADHIDADALDEQARAMLNLSDPADIVVMYPDNDKLF